MLVPLSVSASQGVVDALEVDADRVRTIVHKVLRAAGVEQAHVLVRTRPSWGAAYLDIRIPVQDADTVDEALRLHVLSDGDTQITYER